MHPANIFHNWSLNMENVDFYTYSAPLCFLPLPAKMFVIHIIIAHVFLTV